MKGTMTWDGIATLIAAGIAALVVVVGYFVQQAIARAAKRSDLYARAMQAIEDYVEGPYVVRRRDGSAAARLSTTRQLSEVQSRLRYFESALTQDAPTSLSRAYAELVATARLEAGSQMSEAWRSRPTRRDRDVPLVKPMPQPRTDLAKRKVAALMAPGAHLLGRAAVGLVVGLGVVPLVGFASLAALVGEPWGSFTSAISASITLAICVSFLGYYSTHLRPRIILIVATILSAATALAWWLSYAAG
jgi:hypothetical protein